MGCLRWRNAMSTIERLSLMWNLKDSCLVQIDKVENGYLVAANNGAEKKLYVLQQPDDADGAIVADLYLRLASETKEEIVAKPVPPVDPPPRKFPATFQRFDVSGGEVWAVFVESGLQWSRNAKELDERIEWLRVCKKLTAEELAPWHAVLAELQATTASVAKAAKS